VPHREAQLLVDRTSEEREPIRSLAPDAIPSILLRNIPKAVLRYLFRLSAGTRAVCFSAAMVFGSNSTLIVGWPQGQINIFHGLQFQYG
jgi:hypothetical protein